MVDSEPRLVWHAEAFKQELRDRLAENGEYVGQLVVGDARRRLNAITDPDWGRQYRAYVARLLDYKVEKKRREVVVTVGVRKARTKWHGYYIELGTARRAAHPFLRPAVFNNRREIVSLISGR